MIQPPLTRDDIERYAELAEADGEPEVALAIRNLITDGERLDFVEKYLKRDAEIVTPDNPLVRQHCRTWQVVTQAEEGLRGTIDKLRFSLEGGGHAKLQVPDFHDVHVLVVGDPMMDVYHFGYADRLSPEAPVPVFQELRQEVRLGGAANVANNLEALGCMVTTAFPPGPMIIKRRFMVGHHQLLRVDEDRRYAEPEIPADRPDVVVISDYAKGACTEAVCQAAIERWRGTGVPVVVDPKGQDWGRYRGATAICPNEHEWREANARDYGREMSRFPTVVLKRGEMGIQLHSGGGTEDFSAQARHVFDVTGAGDTVTAVVAATLGTGGDLRLACQLANLAAGYVVGEVGTATCPIHILRELASA